MRIVNYEQGSESWLEWRRGKITASMAPIILGISPYQTPLELYNQIVNRTEQKKSQSMQFGSDKEWEAREWIENEMNLMLSPLCIESDDYPWMAASMDGMSEDLGVGIEIKWNNKENHEMCLPKMHKGILQNRIVEHHYAQVQHQMSVTGLDRIYYVSCWKDDKIFFPVYRNQDYIDNLLKEEEIFRNRILDLDPPAICERDKVYVQSDKQILFDEMCAEYLRLNEQINALTELKKETMEYIKNQTGPCCSSSYSLKKSIVKGSYDFKKYFDIRTDLLQFVEKKPDTESWRITKI